MAYQRKCFQTKRSSIPNDSTIPITDQCTPDEKLFDDQEDTFDDRSIIPVEWVCPPPPKHFRFPEIDQPSEIINELILFGYAGIASALQFLHIYRTVWWLPKSFTDHTMNIHLIDPYLVTFITLLLIRRIIYYFLIKLVDYWFPKKYFWFMDFITRWLFFSVLMFGLGICCAEIFEQHTYLVIYLCYPLIVYVIGFGFEIEPFLRCNYGIEIPYFNQMPLHCCSIQSHQIRTEISSFRKDVINRVKQVFFTAILNAYYVGFIPCCFAPSYIHYDRYTVMQHMIFVLLGGLTLCSVICLPATYSDVLHRAAMHLGQWKRLYNTMCFVEWSDQYTFANGSSVDFLGETYQSNGPVTAAVPGNKQHGRFFIIFQNPSYIYNTLAVLQMILVIVQMGALLITIEWHTVLSLAYLLLANYYTLFKIIRDSMVSTRVYDDEMSLYRNIDQTINTDKFML